MEFCTYMTKVEDILLIHLVIKLELDQKRTIRRPFGDGMEEFGYIGAGHDISVPHVLSDPGSTMPGSSSSTSAWAPSAAKYANPRGWQ
eukprot:scaffold48398_cov74-Attheya_sp.AAC.1